MNASELRIGNYVDPYHNWNGPVQITSISENKIIHTPSSNGAVNDNLIKPIPLTEKWLEKFGFVIDWQDGYYDISIGPENILTIEFPPSEISGWEFQIGHGINWSKPFSIKYVHHLQNLYFALTGTELTITK